MENNHIWKANEQVAQKRKQLETLLEKIKEVTFFIRCITGQKKENPGTQIRNENELKIQTVKRKMCHQRGDLI